MSNIRNISYGYYVWTLARCSSIWFCGLRSSGLCICLRGNNELCRSYFISTFHAFGISVIPNDICTLRWCSFIWFCGLRRFRLHMGLYDGHCLFKSRSILAFCTFAIYHMRTEIWTIVWYYFCSSVFSVVLMHTWVNTIMPGQVSLNLFLRIMLLTFVVHSLKCT